MAGSHIDVLVGELHALLVPGEYVMLEPEVVKLIAERNDHHVWKTFFDVKGKRISAEGAFEAFARERLLPPGGSDKIPAAKDIWRGPLGESILHPCFLLMDADTDNTTTELGQLARMILVAAPQLLNCPYHGEMYAGETCLHLAVAKNDLKTMQWLLSRGADMEVNASGQFFKRFLWGEDPVSWAACSGRREVLGELLAEKARRRNPVTYADTRHNTVLHNMVLAPGLRETEDFKAIFGILGSSQGGGSGGGGVVSDCLHMLNDAGMTPLQVSASDPSGHFGALMECIEVVQWRFGDVVCAAHPLQGWDSACTGDFDEGAGRLDSGLGISAIEHAVNRDNLAFFGHPLNKLLVLTKWRTFVLRRLLRKYACFVVFVALATACVNLQGGGDRQSGSTSAALLLRVFTLALAAVGMAFYGGMAWRVRRTRFYQMKASFGDRALSLRAPLLAGHALIFVAVLLRIVQDCTTGAVEVWVRWLQELTAPPGMLLCWFSVAEVFMLNAYLGSVALVVWEILQSDLPAWILLQGMLMFGFASTLNFLYNPSDLEGHTPVFDTFGDTLLHLLFTPFGDLLDAGTLRETKHDIYVVSTYFLYAMLSCILTLNLSIALFTERMSRTMQNIGPLWLRSWTNLCILEEKQMSLGSVKAMRCGHQLGSAGGSRCLITQRVSPLGKGDNS